MSKRLVPAVCLVATLGYAWLAFAQTLGLPQADARYYRVGGRDVTIQDGGTNASDAPTARRNLDVPGRSTNETISGTWSFDGGVTLGSTVSVEDTSFSIIDNNVNSRVLMFNVNGISNATTRTLTVPDRSSTIATLGGDQTFTGGITFSGDNTYNGGNTFNDVVGIAGTLSAAGAPYGTVVVVDTATFIVDNNVATRRLRFIATAIPNDTTYSVAFPAGGTAVLTNAAQTVSAKTMALGSNTITGSLSDFNTALTGEDFASLTGTETLTNKTVTDTTFTMVDNNVASRTLKFNVTGNSNSADIVLHGVATADRNDTIPNVSAMLANLGATAQIFRGALDVKGNVIAQSNLTVNGDFGLMGATNTAGINNDNDGAVASALPTVEGTLATSVARLNLTAQAAGIGATSIVTAAGQYLVMYEMTCTTGDVTAGSITFDTIATGDGGAQTVSSASLPLTTATVSATNPVRGTIVRYLASGTLDYSVTVTGAVNAARYALRVRAVLAE